MAKKQNYNELADKIIDLVGGKDNISLFSHCVTRLRFNLKDKTLANLEEIEKCEGVVGVQWQSEQLQIIIGQTVGDVYDIICEKAGLRKEAVVEEDLDGKKKKFSAGALIEAITGCLTPLIGLIMTAGLIKIIVLLGTQTGLLSAESSTYTVLSFVGDAGFYFLPVFVGGTAANKFKANMGLGMLVGAMLIHPTFVQSIADGTALSVFGIPIYEARYTSTILPTIMAVYVMSKIERFFAKISPNVVRSITEPLLTMLVMIPLTLCAIGPAGAFLGNYIADGMLWLYNTTGFFGVAVFAAVKPFIILTGMHMAFFPYTIQMLASVGYEPIGCLSTTISNFNQGAASMGVAVKSKITERKSMAASCAFATIVGGVTEPTMFGITLKYKTPMVASMIGSFVGGAIAGLMHIYAYSLPASGGIFGLPIYIGDNIMNVVELGVALMVSMVITFVVTLFIYKDENADSRQEVKNGI